MKKQFINHHKMFEMLSKFEPKPSNAKRKSIPYKILTITSEIFESLWVKDPQKI